MLGRIVKRVALVCLLAAGFVAVLADAAPAQERYGASVNVLSEEPQQHYILPYLITLFMIGGGLAVVLRPSFRRPYQT